MNKLTREQFIETVKEMVSAQMGKGCRVRLHQVTRNNGRTLNGIVIKGSDEALSPVVYLDYYYEEYQKGKPLEAIAKDVVYVYMANKCSVSFNVGEFMQFQSIRSKIVMKLINFHQNQELLEEVPNRKVLDLAVVPYVLLDGNVRDYTSILIRNTHLEIWGVSEDEVFACAEENSKRLLPASIKRIDEILRDMFESGQTDEFLEEDIKRNLSTPQMYILSNQKQFLGASCLLYEGVLKGFAMELGTDVIILPSSIHELILIPMNCKMEADNLRKMVGEINREEVELEERLSDSVYYYERENDSIRIMK